MSFKGVKPVVLDNFWDQEAEEVTDGTKYPFKRLGGMGCLDFLNVFFHDIERRIFSF